MYRKRFYCIGYNSQNLVDGILPKKTVIDELNIRLLRLVLPNPLLPPAPVSLFLSAASCGFGYVPVTACKVRDLFQISIKNLPH